MGLSACSTALEMEETSEIDFVCEKSAEGKVSLDAYCRTASCFLPKPKKFNTRSLSEGLITMAGASGL